MRKVFGSSVAGLMIAALLQFAPTAQGQETTVNVGRAQANPIAMNGGSNDQQIAALLYGANRNEVELAKFVQQKLHSNEAKEFAMQMIKDHQQAADKLARLAGPYVSVTMPRDGSSSSAPIQNADANTGGAVNVQTGGAGVKVEVGGQKIVDIGAQPNTQPIAPQSTLDWISIHRQVGDQYLMSSKEELRAHEGAAFDHCYIGMQIGAHMKMVDEMKVLSRYASNDLRQEIESSMQTASMHLKEAKKIMEHQVHQNNDRSKSPVK